MTDTNLILRPRAILFDHDGVLANSEPLHRWAWRKLLEELKIPFIDDEFRTQVGRTGPETMAHLLDLHRPGWTSGDYNLDALALRKNDRYIFAVPAQLKPYPGALEGLEWLKDQRIKVAVVSNAKKRELQAGLEAMGFVELVDVILSRDDVPKPKPDPSAYLAGALALGIAPRNCLVVEDSPPGIESGLRAGIPCAAVLTSFSASRMSAPVANRPDLKPIWIGATLQSFFEWLQRLPIS